MTEQLGHGSKVYPGHDETAGECVAEVMPAEVLDAGVLNRILEPAAPITPTNARCAWNNVTRIVPSLPEFLQGFACNFIHRNGPALAVLTSRNIDEPEAKIHVLPVQPVLLVSPHAGMQRQIEFRLPLWR